jgi:hypothetical protein
VDPTDFEQYTPAGVAVFCDSEGKTAYGSYNDDTIDFYA